MAGKPGDFWTKAVEKGYDPIICHTLLSKHSRVFSRRRAEKVAEFEPWVRGSWKFACEAAEEYWGSFRCGDDFKNNAYLPINGDKSP